MKFGSKKRTLKTVKTITCLVSFLMACLLFASPLLAQPTTPGTLQMQINAKMAELEKVKAELALLDEEFEITVEAYNKACFDLQQTDQNLRNTKASLIKIEADLEILKTQFAKRIRQIYKTGDVKVFEILLNTNSFADFLTRVSFLMKISQQDATQVKALHDMKVEVEKQKMKLEMLRQQQLAIEQQLEAKKVEIQLKLIERQQFMNSLDAEIKLLIAQEQQLQAILQTELRAKVAELIQKGIIKVTPGSIVYTALKYLGVPYVWAGDTPRGFDCSGFTMYIFAEHGTTLPHYSGAQFQMGIAVPKEYLMPGDLVFFGTPVHHVGMYIGGGYFIHASGAYDYVRIDQLAERADYVGARRIPLAIPNLLTPVSTIP